MTDRLATIGELPVLITVNVEISPVPDVGIPILGVSQFNVADMFTKSLPRPAFTGFVMLFMTDPERH